MSEHIIDMSNSSYQSTSGLLCADVSQLKEEIVRCRDCKEYIELKGYATCGYFGGDYVEIEPDGFCKWGERRAD